MINLLKNREKDIPPDIVYEWELIHAIFDYNNISLDPIYYIPKNTIFNCEDIKRHYYFLNSPQFWGNTYYIFDMYETDNRQFIKRYGENGLHDFLNRQLYSLYDKKKDIWYLSVNFYQRMMNYYKQTQKIYGNDFLKFIR